MDRGQEPDQFLNVARLNLSFGILAIVCGVVLALLGKPSGESALGFLSQQMGVAMFTAGAINLLAATAFGKLKDYLTRDARQLHQALNDAQERLAKDITEMKTRVGELLARADQAQLLS